MTLRVLLADDHQIFREALRLLLEKESDIEVVAETGDGTEVPRLVKENAVDIVCMDISMPGMNGVEATRRLAANSSPVKVIALSAYPDHRYVTDMVRAGAVGYVTKAEAGTELMRAIRTVVRNKVYLCPDVMEAVSGALCSPDAEAGVRTPNQLGPRERQVLQLVAEGCSSGEIAARLHIAPSTVEVHRRNIMRKLDLHNVADLTRYSIRSGLVSA
jgi:two-component system NarL family response regulator